MEFRLLGPLEAGEPPIPVGGGKQRALLAILLLSPGRTIPRERLIDLLWGAAPPETAAKMVQIHVSQLRKVLPAGLLVTRPPGYALDVPPAAVDLHRAERLRAEGRASLAAGRPADAASLLEEALALWRGRALVEFDEPFAQGEEARIEELRLAIQECRIEADLALGRHDDLIGELDALVAQHPLREGFRRLQMLALYRCGRQAEALASFQDARRALADELGLDPSPALREMELRILRHDRGLDAPRPPVPAPPAPGAPAPEPDAGGLRVRYARSGRLSIAYEVSGSGPPDLVLIPGFVSHLRMDRAHPSYRGFLDRLASFSRLIRFDKRGTGLSDRPEGLPDLERRMDDVRAVMDAVGSSRGVLLGYSEGGPLATLFAATHRDRVGALILVNSYAKRIGPDADYPWATPADLRQQQIDQLEREWGYEALAAALCPSADATMRLWWAERCRAGASPGAARALAEMNRLIDVRDVLPAIAVPTLVVHRGGDLRVVPGHGRYLAERIPGATFAEVAGVDHFVGVDPGPILDVVEPWVRALGGQPPPAAGPRAGVFATCVAPLDVHDEAVLRRELAAHRGRPQAGCALFDGPARAIRFAIALAALEPPARVGVHTGEVCEGGGPALVAARALAAAAAPGEVLVTATTHDLVPGSGLRFDDRGERLLPGGMPRRVYAAVEQPTAPAAGRAPAAPRLAGDAPFVGREPEMSLLLAAFEAAAAGRGRLVTVTGDPGIGKTRVAREVADLAEARGALVLRGRAYEHEGAPPYLPWSQALRALVVAADAQELEADAGGGAADLCTLVPELGERLPGLAPPPAGGDAEQGRFRLLDAVAGILESASARRPLVVVLEDLHAADPGSLRMLEFVARALPRARILLIATYRDSEAGAGTGLVATLAELTREQPVDHLALRGLGPEAVREVITSAAGTPPSDALVEAAVAQTEGNPLFLTELARLLAQDRASGRDGPRLRIPDGVRAVIGQRLGRLSDGCQATLRLAAVLGRELGLRELGAAMGGDAAADLVTAMDEALAARVVEDVATSPGRVQFCHGLIRETLLEGMSAARRADLAGRVLHALEGLHGRAADAHAAQLLFHAEDALPLLGPEPVVRYALTAGERALEARAYEEAAGRFRRALRALDQGDPGDERVALACFGLGRALLASRELHELDEAVASLQRAFERYASGGDASRAIAVATHPLPPHLHLEDAGATRLVERALELVAPASADAARLLATLGWLTGICRADIDAAGVAFERAIGIARSRRDPALEVRALVQRQYVEMFHLRWDACRATGLRAIELAAAVGDRRNEMAAHGWVARSLARSGDLAAARRHAGAATPHAEDLRERYWRATAGLHNAMLAALGGDWDTARRWGDEALRARPSDPRVLGLRALVEYQTGELTAGAAFLVRLCAPLAQQPVPGPGAEHPFAAAHVPLCARIAAIPEAHLGAAARSGELVLALAAAPAYLRSLAHIGLGLVAAARGDAAAAASHHEALLPLAGTASVVPPVAVDRLLCVMALAAGRPDQAVSHGRDAVAFCERAGYGPELGWSAVELAEALAGAGEDTAARSMRARARAIAHELGIHPIGDRLAPVA